MDYLECVVYQIFRDSQISVINFKLNSSVVREYSLYDCNPFKFMRLALWPRM